MIDNRTTLQNLKTNFFTAAVTLGAILIGAAIIVHFI